MNLSDPAARNGRRALLWFAAVLSVAGCSRSDIRATDPPPAATSPSAAPALDPLAPMRNGLRPHRLRAGEALPRWSLEERMAHYKVPGVAVAVIRNGEVVAARGYGLREAGTTDAVDADTLFSVGSVSKVATASIALRAVAAGRFDLDRDVNGYLSSWKITPQPGIADPHVSLRMLLSHTAGLDVHGFPDFQPGEALPTLRQILDGAPPAKGGTVKLIHQPGSRFDYSGGGTMIVQLMLQEQAHESFEAIARRELFGPARMTRSTFENPLPAERGNIAKAHNDKGERVALPRGWEAFPEQAASGLWTSANDLGRFAAILLRSYKGRDPFLPRSIAQAMMTEVSPSMHGLGPRIEGKGDMRVFQHGGDNDSYHASIEGSLESGDGFVILTNGDGAIPLRGEIRAAFSDALGYGVNAPQRIVELDFSDRSYDDYAGRYVRDEAIPADIARGMIDMFEYTEFSIVRDGATFAVVLSGEEKPFPLLALAPDRFVGNRAAGFEFTLYRDAHGKVRGASVDRGNARLYFRRRDG